MNKRLRRDPQSHLQSLKMDPVRKILVVEGKSDRLFMKYIGGSASNENLVVLEIESVDIPDSVDSGNRGRIIAFSNMCSESEESIRFWIDKDYWVDEDLKSQIILTDFKDSEAYLLTEKCYEKFMKIGLSTDRVGGLELLSVIKSICFFGYLRMIQQHLRLDLPINLTNISIRKYIDISISPLSITIDEDKYFRVLLQNGASKVCSKEDLVREIDSIRKKHKLDDPRNILHGKDTINILDVLSKEILGKKIDSIDSIYKMSFEKEDIAIYPNLTSIYSFITT